MTSFIRVLLCLCLIAFATYVQADTGNAEYVGTIPCDNASRAFVGGIASNVPCHTITWHLTLSTNLNANQRATFQLRAQYGLQGKADTNQLEKGPAVEMTGEWETAGKTASMRPVYRLFAPGRAETLLLTRLGGNLLHFLNPDKSLRIGNPGWSYTLNRKGVFPVTPLSANAIEPATAAGSTNFWMETARRGARIHGYFEGRSPCQEISRLLNVSKSDECIKIKWQLILYHDPVTGVPTTYALGGVAWRNPPKIGKWKRGKGTREDPDAVIYQLELDNAGTFLSFQRADENILLFLGHDREPLVGNEKFSYTLNRIEAGNNAAR